MKGGSLRSSPLSETIGSSVTADKAELLSGVHAGEIRKLLVERGVLCFPDVWLDDEEQLAFARTLGEIASDWDVSADKLVNRNLVLAEYQKSSVHWHFDGFGVLVPEFATIMSPRILADGHAGATDFANCYAAWRDLPEEERRAIDGLKVRHSFETLMRLVRPEPGEEELQAWRTGGAPHTQPLVWHHGAGACSLLLGASASYVEAMPGVEGQALISRLNAWITRPQYTWRYQWKLGDLVVWDNTGVLHRAVPYRTDSKRLMHRTTVLGFETPA